jgi:hypothetical protein
VASGRNEYQKIFLRSKEWPTLKADNLAAIYEPIIYKLWDPDISKPYRPSMPVRGIA